MSSRKSTRILFIEPFFGGSHRAFAEGLKHSSRHCIRLLTLPARFWKWRMRGAAVTLSEKANRMRFPYEAMIATDMLNLAEFRSLLARDAPSLLYMHENQVSYPVPEGESRDVQFGFTNVTSCLAADKVCFNSRYHYNSFFDELDGFLRQMPDYRLKNASARIMKKSRVLPLGVDLGFFDAFPRMPLSGPPVILWNHRWEFDKRPELFFACLKKLRALGMDFRLAIAGENFQAKPKAFLEAKKIFAKQIIHYGFAETREDYARLLKNSDIVISTASQENFGISAVEAAYCGAWPLFPRGLSYPELIPQRYHRDHLYSNFDDLVIKLKEILPKAEKRRQRRKPLADAFFRFDWSNMIEKWDSIIESLVASRGKRNRS